MRTLCFEMRFRFVFTQCRLIFSATVPHGDEIPRGDGDGAKCSPDDIHGDGDGESFPDGEFSVAILSTVVSKFDVIKHMLSMPI